MEKYRIYRMALLAILSTALVSTMLSNALAIQPSEINILQATGVDGPFFNGEDVTATYSFQLEGLSKGSSGNYLTVNFDGFDGRISVPGCPALPYKVHVIEVLGDAVIDEIGVNPSPISYTVEQLSRKVLPAPNPMFYGCIENQKLVYEESSDIYTADKYFPGSLLAYYVGHGSGGKTLITMQLYPLQYNPVTSKLMIFNSIKVSVKYHVEEYQQPSEKMVIITTSELNGSVLPLAEFYNTIIGLSTEIKTTNWIYSTYPLAKNITEYSGFYAPVQLDPSYYMLVNNYNWTLALRIVSYLKDTNPTHVLLVGGADIVPPSFYYQSPFISGYRPWWGWVPTDYFYASTDYDLIPERSVGRIPFNDKATVQKVVNKILLWYDATWPSRPDWMRNLAMSGGYPFSASFMMGESALSNVTREGHTRMFNTTLLMRTDGNYNAIALQNLLRNGGIGWLFMLCHGSGTELADMLITDGSMEYEILASAKGLLTYPTNHNLPVVTSVACMNGAWDENLLSPEFTPPSFGECVLMSNASGIAYIGSARPAYEIGIYFPFDEGLLNAEFYGAALMHTLFIKAYNNLMGLQANVSLGEVFAKGLEDYVSTMVPLFESSGDKSLMDTVYSNIFMLNLMGDPGLKLPVYDGPFLNEQVTDVDAIDPDFMIDSEYLSQGWGATKGTIPFYKPLKNATMEISGVGEKVSVRIVQTYFSAMWLYGYKTVAVTEEPFEFGKANVTVTTNQTISGLLLFKVKVKGVEARFYMTSGGLTVEPTKATPSSTINVKGIGLNIVPAYSVSLTIGGWLVAHLNIPLNGSAEWSFAAPFFDPGIYPIGISFMTYMPPYQMPLPPPAPPELVELFQKNVTILPLPEKPGLEIRITSGTQYEPGDTVTIRIATTLNGKLTDANLSVNLIKPTAVVRLTPQRIAEGEYQVELLAPSTPATYFVSVKAEIYYTFAAFRATAYDIHAFTVTVSFEELKDLIQTANTELIQLYLDQLNTTIVQIFNRTVEIQTMLGTVEGYIKEINDTTVTIVSTLGNLNLRIGEIQQLINDAKGDVIAEIETKYGLLNLALSDINGTIVHVSDETVEVRTVLGTIEGNIVDIKNGMATIQTNVGEIRVATDNISQEQLPSATHYSIATLAAAAIAILMVAIIMTVIIRKPKSS